MTRLAWLLVALAGFAALGVGLATDPRRAFSAYLAAEAALLSVSLGAIAWLLLARVARAGWMEAYAPALRRIARLLPLALMLLIPLAFGLRHLYAWTGDTVQVRTPGLLLERTTWFSLPFFAGRALAAIAVWLGALVLAVRIAAVRRAAAGAVLVAFVFAWTVTIIDWIMSLAPSLHSTAFAPALIAASALTALGLAAALTPVPPQRTTLAAVLFAAALGWCFIAGTQYLSMWLANLPKDAVWLGPRTDGGWGALALLVAAVRVGVPAAALIAAGWGHRAALAGGAALGLAHLADLHWLVVPQVRPDAISLHWLDAAALAAIGGTIAAVHKPSHS